MFRYNSDGFPVLERAITDIKPNPNPNPKIPTFSNTTYQTPSAPKLQIPTPQKPISPIRFVPRRHHRQKVAASKYHRPSATHDHQNPSKSDPFTDNPTLTIAPAVSNSSQEYTLETAHINKIMERTYNKKTVEELFPVSPSEKHKSTRGFKRGLMADSMVQREGKMDCVREGGEGRTTTTGFGLSSYGYGNGNSEMFIFRGCDE